MRPAFLGARLFGTLILDPASAITDRAGSARTATRTCRSACTDRSRCIRRRRYTAASDVGLFFGGECRSVSVPNARNRSAAALQGTQRRLCALVVDLDTGGDVAGADVRETVPDLPCGLSEPLELHEAVLRPDRLHLVFEFLQPFAGPSANPVREGRVERIDVLGVPVMRRQLALVDDLQLDQELV